MSRPPTGGAAGIGLTQGALGNRGSRLSGMALGQGRVARFEAVFTVCLRTRSSMTTASKSPFPSPTVDTEISSRTSSHAHW